MESKSRKSTSVKKTTTKAKKPARKTVAKEEPKQEVEVVAPPEPVKEQPTKEQPTWSNGRPKSIRKMGRPGTLLKSQLEEEQLRLKNEKLKLFLSDWRRARDREIAVAVVESLKTSLLALKDDIAKGMPLNQSIDKVLKSLATVDYDLVLTEVEHDDDEEEDEQ